MKPFHAKYCDAALVQQLFKTKDRLNPVPKDLFLSSRSRANPYEKIGKHFFINRAALKLANLDKLAQLTDPEFPEEVRNFFTKINFFLHSIIDAENPSFIYQSREMSSYRN